MESLVVAILVCGLRRDSMSDLHRSTFHAHVVEPLSKLGAQAFVYICTEDIAPRDFKLALGERYCNVSRENEQWTRLHACYACALHWESHSATLYTHFIRTRPDLIYYGPIKPAHFPLVNECVSARFRIARGFNTSDDYFSWHWGTQECGEDVCNCFPCFLFDDQFAIMTRASAPVYFRARLLSETARVSHLSCPTQVRWGTEIMLTRVLLAHDLCIHPLNLQFRISGRNLPKPRPVPTKKVC